MRRTLATLLVVASPALMGVPVDARESRTSGPAAPVVVPAPVPSAVPAGHEAVAPPAAPAGVSPAVPATTTPAVAAARPAVTAVRRVVRGGADAPGVAPAAAPADDAAYAARLHAELCQARAVFCGLEHGGRYPAG